MSSHCGVCKASMGIGNEDRLCCRVCAVTLHKECAERLELKQHPMSTIGSETPKLARKFNKDQLHVKEIDSDSHWRRCMDNVSMNLMIEDISFDKIELTNNGILMIESSTANKSQTVDICNTDKLNGDIQRIDTSPLCDNSSNKKLNKPYCKSKPLQLDKFSLNKVQNNTNYDIIYSCRNCVSRMKKNINLYIYIHILSVNNTKLIMYTIIQRNTKDILNQKDRKVHRDILAKLDMQNC